MNMYSSTQTMMLITILAITLPLPLAFPYPIYGLTNFRRTSRTNQFPAYIAPMKQYDDQSYRSQSSHPSMPYLNYHQSLQSQPYDSDYMDDEVPVDRNDRYEREYQYGTKTYHGEYKPSSRYYYARAPSYNYYDDRAESALDDLHEEMLQEDRQRTYPLGKTQWFQNTGQPKSLTNDFLKNLYLYNKGINPASVAEPTPDEMANAYDDEDVDGTYYSDVSNQPYDYYDGMKSHKNQQKLTYAGDVSSNNKQSYFNHEVPSSGRNQEDFYGFNNDRYDNSNKVRDGDIKDKEEKDLKSLRKLHNIDWNSNEDDGSPDDDIEKNSHFDSSKTETIHPHVPGFTDKIEDASTSLHDTYDSGFDYDDDAWINWNRKRSLFKSERNNSPLKALEQKLKLALEESQHESKHKLAATTTTTPLSASTAKDVEVDLRKLEKNDNGPTHKHQGQKEVVLSRPATPIRHRFSDTVIDALTKTSGQKSNQEDDQADEKIGVDNKTQQIHHPAEAKIHKRFVSSEASLEQQLDGLKQKIRT